MVVMDYRKENELTQEQKQYKYMNTKDIAKLIRKDIRQNINLKISVRTQYYSGGSCLNITIPNQHDLYINEEYRQKIQEIVEKYQVGLTDPYTDYYDYNFYYSIYFN